MAKDNVPYPAQQHRGSDSRRKQKISESSTEQRKIDGAREQQRERKRGLNSFAPDLVDHPHRAMSFRRFHPASPARYFFGDSGIIYEAA